ncbi:hypothetical protein [Hwanghaeella sp. LZ110]|uniref:hypothetical protein n=1 Tax=Hwanghaeella sp. LZ110 TaxID=3402810 RepID=UPI003B681771
MACLCAHHCLSFLGIVEWQFQNDPPNSQTSFKVEFSAFARAANPDTSIAIPISLNGFTAAYKALSQ